MVGEVAENNEVNGCIYKATNILNKKVYIGQTMFDLDKRKSEHQYFSSSIKYRKSIFSYALNKYGFENFEWEVIDSFSNKHEANVKEIHWIQLYKSYIGFKESHGYNMTIGGLGHSGYKHTLETKEKIRNAHKGKRTYGDSHVAKKVLQFSLEGNLIAKHDSAKSGADSVKGHLQNITDCCRGYKQKTANGFVWIYEQDYSIDFLQKRISVLPKQNYKPSRVQQYLLDGTYVNTFSSFYEASKITQSDRSSISKCCKGKIKHHNGYVWKLE